MKRVLTGLFAIGTVVTILYVPAKAAPQSAVVIKDGACVLFDADGGLAFGDFIDVSTNGGVTNFTCKAKGVANSNHEAKILNYANTGVLCNTTAGATDDWQETISASGNATLKCQVKDE